MFELSTPSMMQHSVFNEKGSQYTVYELHLLIEISHQQGVMNESHHRVDRQIHYVPRYFRALSKYYIGGPSETLFH